MAAPKGNKFYLLALNPGKPRVFDTPAELLSRCTEYFEWLEANPLKEEKLFNGKDGVKRATIDKMRAPLVKHMCLFLGIAENTWSDYRTGKRGIEFASAAARVDQMIFSEKFQGASAGLLESNIIVRELGLADKQDSNLGDALTALLDAIDGNSRNNPGERLLGGDDANSTPLIEHESVLSSQDDKD